MRALRTLLHLLYQCKQIQPNMQPDLQQLILFPNIQPHQLVKQELVGHHQLPKMDLIMKRVKNQKNLAFLLANRN